VRASMGSLFARPPARADFDELTGTRIALHARADRTLADVEPAGPVVLCVGAEREGLPDELLAATDDVVRIPLRRDGPESLNAGVAAAVALHELATRMAGHA
jgi:TrmH family RNA methyltransferase